MTMMVDIPRVYKYNFVGLDVVRYHVTSLLFLLSPVRNLRSAPTLNKMGIGRTGVMANQWFRMYAEVLNDPKVQKLSPELFKIWVNILCMVCNSNGTLHETLEDNSFALHETKECVSSAFHHLEKCGLLVTVDETFHVYNWNKRQYKSDTSTNRVKRWRKQKRNVAETHQIQNRTDSDTEQKESKLEVVALSSAPPESQPVKKSKSVRGSRLTKDWVLPKEWGIWAESSGMARDAILKEMDKFKDYWIAKSGSQATKMDWEATWRNWVRKHLEEYAK